MKLTVLLFLLALTGCVSKKDEIIKKKSEVHKARMEARDEEVRLNKIFLERINRGMLENGDGEVEFLKHEVLKKRIDSLTLIYDSLSREEAKL